jgi:hypothetical protein
MGGGSGLWRMDRAGEFLVELYPLQRFLSADESRMTDREGLVGGAYTGVVGSVPGMTCPWIAQLLCVRGRYMVVAAIGNAGGDWHQRGESFLKVRWSWMDWAIKMYLMVAEVNGVSLEEEVAMSCGDGESSGSGIEAS